MSQRDIGNALLHRDLTEKIVGAAFEVHNQLGFGFLEKVYENVFIHELGSRDLKTVAQAEIPVLYKGRPVGVYFADVLVEDNVICEIKAVRAIAPEHEAQILHYLTATGIQVGLILNFGASRLQYKRFAKSK